jgi:hypothetical protein
MARRPGAANLLAFIRGEQTDAVRALEDRIGGEAIGRADEDFQALQRRTLTAWTVAFGGPQQQATDAGTLRRLLAAVRAAVRRILGPLAPRSRRALDRRLDEAVTLGAQQHQAYLADTAGRQRRRTSPAPSRSLRSTASAVVDVVARRRDRALQLLRMPVATRWSRVATGIGAARGAIGAIRTHISWAVGQAVQEGLTAGIRAIGAQKLWISERDACVSCAAYAGLLADVDADFPAGLSWDPAQRGRGESLPAPPLHPNCRCRCVAWKPEWASDGIPSLPDALRREARRSIARGWSLPTESGAARIRAARELLATGANLPKSVEEFAAHAVAAGRFANRTVPTGP